MCDRMCCLFWCICKGSTRRHQCKTIVGAQNTLCCRSLAVCTLATCPLDTMLIIQAYMLVPTRKARGAFPAALHASEWGGGVCHSVVEAERLRTRHAHALTLGTKMCTCDTYLAAKDKGEGLAGCGDVCRRVGGVCVHAHVLGGCQLCSHPIWCSENVIARAHIACAPLCQI